jgi:hypothetical protein
MYIEQKKIEKEGKVIELYLKGYTRRQIAKELKMSTRDVCRIINNYREKINPTREVSNTSKAFTMYSEGKGPTEAVIELDISPSDAENMYSDYLRLSDRQQVNAFYDELEERLPDLLSLHKIVKKYDRVENRKIIKKRTTDLEYIISKQLQKLHDIEIEIEQSLEYKFGIKQEIQILEEQLDNSRKRFTNQW